MQYFQISVTQKYCIITDFHCISVIEGTILKQRCYFFKWLFRIAYIQSTIPSTNNSVLIAPILLMNCVTYQEKKAFHHKNSPETLSWPNPLIRPFKSEWRKPFFGFCICFCTYLVVDFQGSQIKSSDDMNFILWSRFHAWNIFLPTDNQFWSQKNRKKNHQYANHF